GLHLVGEIEVEERCIRASLLEPAVAEVVDHLPRVALPGHDQHVADAGELEQLERVVDHRPASDRQQVLVRDARQLAEARGLAACTDEAPQTQPRWRAILQSALLFAYGDPSVSPALAYA